MVLNTGNMAPRTVFDHALSLVWMFTSSSQVPCITNSRVKKVPHCALPPYTDCFAGEAARRVGHPYSRNVPNVTHSKLDTIGTICDMRRKWDPVEVMPATITWARKSTWRGTNHWYLLQVLHDIS